MPNITVDMLDGRSLDQKRALVRELTDAFVRTCGSAPESVHVLIHDFSKQNWAVGGQLYADREGGPVRAGNA